LLTSYEPPIPLSSQVPEVGGHTNFAKAGVHIKPKPGQAAFLGYVDPEILITDDHLIEHSGCPVFEGNKTAILHFVRYGVDHMNPWNSFDSSKSGK
jgi:hypothetical protein